MKNEEYISVLKNAPPHTPPRGVVCAVDFDAFWKAYPRECPRKVDKIKCRRKFDALAKAAPDAAEFMAEVMAGLERWKRSETWCKDDGAFICAPLVWLNNERWRDEPKPMAVAAAPVPEKPQRKPTAEDWELCAERCSVFQDGRCTAGVAMPPPLQKRPAPPEECPGFAPLR